MDGVWIGSQLTAQDMKGIILIAAGVILVGFGVYAVIRDKKNDRL